MGSFQLPENTARMVFEDSPYEGAEVVCRLDMPLGVYFDVMALDPAKDIRGIVEIFGREVLRNWNLRDDKGDIPANEEGLKRIPVGFVGLLFQKWKEVMENPPAPLGKPSSNGVTSEERKASPSPSP